MIDRTAIPSPTATTVGIALATARIAASPGLMIALNS
jgi:hypothetical protein